ncbi:pyruvate dehydrogenase complex E1 component subunit beta [Niveibacterium sp. SC-1]|uniref:alpha-ketoacid dehydrogenase subunit beta n=1 Tax=Niveibacterium sp. SC-1 TaxID=3135646 RepID=UPI00311EB0A6
MDQVTIEAAIGQALAEEMARDARVLTFGEGVALKRRDLAERFGAERVRNTPLSEAIIAGTAAGAAATGLRPVIDMLYIPFLTLAMDAIANSAGKLRYISGGQFSFPLVVMAQTGAGWGVGAQHTHNLEAWFAHTPGLKVVMPSNAADAKGLLKAAIRDENPVLFFTDMTLGFNPGEVAEGEAALVPIGKAALRRAGCDVTLVSYSKAVHTCLAAAEQLAAQGVEAEVLDLRTVKPLDEAAILRSVKKTGRLIVVHEGARFCGVGAEIAALVSEQAHAALKAPVRRITPPDVPVPASYALEQAFLPQAQAVVDAVLAICPPHAHPRGQAVFEPA